MIVHPHAQPRPPVKSVISRAKRHVTLPHPKVEYGGLGRKKGCFTSIRTVLNRRLAPKWGRPKFGGRPYAARPASAYHPSAKGAKAFLTSASEGLRMLMGADLAPPWVMRTVPPRQL